MHSDYVAERVYSRNNILKALAGTSWGQQKETVLITYKAVRRSIINYAAPVWSTNLRDTNYRNIQYVCHSITTRETPKRRMRETLYTRHRNTVEPMMLADNRKATLQAIHTDAVNKAVKYHKNNIVLDDLPQPINNSEKDLAARRHMTSNIASLVRLIRRH